MAKKTNERFGPEETQVERLVKQNKLSNAPSCRQGHPPEWVGTGPGSKFRNPSTRGLRSDLQLMGLGGMGYGWHARGC